MSVTKFKIFEGSGTRDLYERVKCADGLGFTTQKCGREEYSFVVEIDEQSLRSLGGRAASNVNAKAVRGGLTAKITRRRKI
jgi:hypothetical protein